MGMLFSHLGRNLKRVTCKGVFTQKTFGHIPYMGRNRDLKESIYYEIFYFGLPVSPNIYYSETKSQIYELSIRDEHFLFEKLSLCSVYQILRGSQKVPQNDSYVDLIRNSNSDLSVNTALNYSINRSIQRF